jgi:regulator of RNase E activity RraA
MLSHADLLKLKRWNTPTIYNGWEQITKNDITQHFNQEPVHDYMPHMGVMVGHAVTVVIEPGNPSHPEANPHAWREYREYVASTPGPKIVIVQDLDKPKAFGAFWGEVNSNVHKALGCVGTITDGSIRDTDEMNNAGFKALARCLSVGHAYNHPVRWGCAVEVFGCRIQPGQLIHADKHGFLAIPPEDEERLYEATLFMDSNECKTIIAAARSATGKSPAEIIRSLDEAGTEFRRAALEKFQAGGER